MALDTEIAAYEERRSELERQYNGTFVVFKGSELMGSFDTLDAAAADAIRRFGSEPFLIRQVGAAAAQLPISVLHSLRRDVPASVAPPLLAFGRGNS